MPSTRLILLTGFVLPLSIAYGVLQTSTEVQETAVHILPVVAEELPLALVTPIVHASAEEDEILPVVDQPDIEPHHQKLISHVLRWLPASCRENLDHLVIKYDPEAERGLSTSSTIFLRGTLSDKELIAVFIHECGHIVDLGALNGTIAAGPSSYPDGHIPAYWDDPSIPYYQVSWDGPKEKKAHTHKHHFVSGYASYNIFEDFAESYALFALHREEFKEMAATDPAIAEKYHYMENIVFGPDFTSAPRVMLNLAQKKRVWDVTKLAHNLTL